jgi:hypothetical protein
MKLPFYFLLAKLLMGLSCTKPKIEMQEALFTEATYAIEVKGKWKLPDLTVPAGVHFTNFAGMVRNEKGVLWEAGKQATKGVENVAETGSATVLLADIDSIIRSKMHCC